jgi:hypothetical protein
MHAHNELQNNTHNKPLADFVLKGAGIALLLVIIFLGIIFSLGGVLAGKTFAQAVWQFLPVITVTAGGALGGMIYYMVVHRLYTGGRGKRLATIFSILLYLALLWFSLIAGFSATGQWD